MLNGNLSAEVTPRILLVAEGALMFLPPEKVDDYNLLGSQGEWARAAECWDLNPMMCRKIWDVAWRQSIQIEVVTFTGPESLAKALESRFDEEGLPVSLVAAQTPQRLAQSLSYRPDVARVYDADGSRALLWGSKGRTLRSVNDFGHA